MAGPEKNAWTLRVLGLAAGPAIGEAVPNEADQREAIRELLQTLNADLKLLQGVTSDSAQEARELFAIGADAARGKDYAAALAALLDCTDAVARARRGESAEEARAAIPEGKVAAVVRQFELAAAFWETSRMGAVEGLDELTDWLEQQDDPDLLEIGGIVAELTTRLPAALESALEALAGAIDLGEATDPHRAALQRLLTDARAFLKDNEPALHRCENNPWQIEVDVVAPLNDALARIEACLRGI